MIMCGITIQILFEDQKWDVLYSFLVSHVILRDRSVGQIMLKKLGRVVIVEVDGTLSSNKNIDKYWKKRVMEQNSVELH